MKPNKDIIIERGRIARSFPAPIPFTKLVATDKADHRDLVEKVYKGMLREAGVIDECCERFDRTFKECDYYLVRLNEI